MSRVRLPDRRAALNFEVGHGHSSYMVALGFHDDGGLGECFITSTKAASDAQIIANEASVAVSFALQHGASVEAMAAAMPRNEDGSPQALIGSVLDAALPLLPARGVSP